ncbi:ankyrin repeat and SOCS box protein 11-like [Saccoglossus kowalevskii]|uniref:Serine/threonine-protein phosphatase 6 regulatory ankyrin repeat subunit A-like n=1 Tax=Saccoglossus kowalevskii TaxID=10224 RepID=A0ABM0H0P8_SACKO|nr:PREDICTED: serine/threonine-protein phosphatase 6 regulatory ankyrin repeat subunit A-like [Saccoglossus kowalevskii]
MGTRHSVSWFDWRTAKTRQSSNYKHKSTPNYNHNWTELHYAASQGNLEKLQELLSIQGKQNIDRQDYYGKTPLYWSAYKGHKDCIEELLKHGADVNSQCKHGSTPLHAVSGLYPDSTLLLIKKGADIDIEDNWGVTPMYLAACSGQIDCIRILVLSGANMTYRNMKTGAIPKQLAEHYEFLQWLKLQSQNARSLKELCRKCIRKTLGYRHIHEVGTLDIPSCLQHYLLLEEINWNIK